MASGNHVRVAGHELKQQGANVAAWPSSRDGLCGLPRRRETSCIYARKRCVCRKGHPGSQDGNPGYRRLTRPGVLTRARHSFGGQACATPRLQGQGPRRVQRQQQCIGPSAKFLPHSLKTVPRKPSDRYPSIPRCGISRRIAQQCESQIQMQWRIRTRLTRTLGQSCSV